MRLCRFEVRATGTVGVGVWTTDGVRPAARAGDDVIALASLISAADQEADAVCDAVQPLALTDVMLLAPIEDPPSLRDFMAFEEHVVTSAEAMGETVDPVWYAQPAFYFTNPAAVHGPYDPIAIAPGSAAFDYELEVAAVIGTGGSDIAPTDAENHIAGFMLLCDWSARDLQEVEMRQRLGPAKGKDSATSFGSIFCTTTELLSRRRANGFDVQLTAHVNGRAYSSGNLAQLHWSFSQMISYASRGTRLRRGDVIGSGTVGSGCILELARVHGADAYPWLAAGDDVHLDGGVLGEIRSQILPSRSEPIPL